MKNIVRAWQSSMTMFLPQNLMPLLMVIFKTLLEVYRLIGTYFWWFILMGLIALMMNAHAIFFVVWIIVWLTLLVEASRPSLLSKNFTYFENNALSCLPVAALFFAACCMPVLLVCAGAPYLILLMFFLCDAHFKMYDIFVAPVRAGKLSLFLAPWYLVIVALLYGAGTLLCCSSSLLVVLMLFLVVPICIVTLSRLYVLFIHKEYKEFYERCW